MNKVTVREESASALSKASAEFWEIANQAECEVERLGRQSLPFVIVAGAAFHLAKAGVEHGEWEKMITARSPISLRTVRARMQAVDNVLEKLGFDLDERAYVSIVFSSKLAPKRHDRAVLKSKFSQHLVSCLADALAGKSGHQLEWEFGVRKGKKAAALPPSSGDTKTDLTRSASEWVFRVSQLLTQAPAMGEHMTREAHGQFTAAMIEALETVTGMTWTGQAGAKRE